MKPSSILIYLCLSSHGFGHAARQAAVFEELYRLEPSFRLVVSSLVDLEFLNLVFKGIPVEQRRVKWDVGMVQENALGVKTSHTLQALAKLEYTLPKFIKSEADWIRKQQTSVIILGDIPSSAAKLAKEVGAKLIWMGNFGWDDIYRPLGGEFIKYAEQITSDYSFGQLLLRFPFSFGMNWGLKEKKIGLTSSNPRTIPAEFLYKITSKSLPIVMVAFGGMGFDLNPKLFSLWPNHIFLISSPLNSVKTSERIDLDNVFTLPQTVRVVDVLRFCERHIGKPGYSSFCEAITQNVGLHVVTRKGFAEADVLIGALKLYGNHLLLNKDELQSGDWKLDKPLIKTKKNPLRTDGAEIAAKIIIDYIYNL